VCVGALCACVDGCSIGGRIKWYEGELGGGHEEEAVSVAARASSSSRHAQQAQAE
jgi:hypothetical protein